MVTYRIRKRRRPGKRVDAPARRWHVVGSRHAPDVQLLASGREHDQAERRRIAERRAIGAEAERARSEARGHPVRGGRRQPNPVPAQDLEQPVVPEPDDELVAGDTGGRVPVEVELEDDPRVGGEPVEVGDLHADVQGTGSRVVDRHRADVGRLVPVTHRIRVGSARRGAGRGHEQLARGRSPSTPSSRRRRARLIASVPRAAGSHLRSCRHCRRARGPCRSSEAARIGRSEAADSAASSFGREAAAPRPVARTAGARDAVRRRVDDNLEGQRTTALNVDWTTAPAAETVTVPRSVEVALAGTSRLHSARPPANRPTAGTRFPDARTEHVTDPAPQNAVGVQASDDDTVGEASSRLADESASPRFSSLGAAAVVG